MLVITFLHNLAQSSVDEAFWSYPGKKIWLKSFCRYPSAKPCAALSTLKWQAVYCSFDIWVTCHALNSRDSVSNLSLLQVSMIARGDVNDVELTAKLLRRTLGSMNQSNETQSHGAGTAAVNHAIHFEHTSCAAYAPETASERAHALDTNFILDLGHSNISRIHPSSDRRTSYAMPSSAQRRIPTLEQNHCEAQDTLSQDRNRHVPLDTSYSTGERTSTSPPHRRSPHTSQRINSMSRRREAWSCGSTDESPDPSPVRSHRSWEKILGAESFPAGSFARDLAERFGGLA